MNEFKCPICGVRLQLEQNTYACANNHCFDKAKEGYVNLLPVQHKKSLNPGDSKAMLSSRRRFLEQQHYAPLVEAIGALLPTPAENLHVLDVGCGEGYYAAALVARFNTDISGIDIAKTGVQMAAKRKCYRELAVASAYQLPFFDKCFDAALSVFSPIDAKETSRVLAAGGCLIMVGPAANHLSGLISHIYDDHVPHQGNKVELGSYFELLDQQRVTWELSLTGAAIYDLLQMTPYYWSCSKEKQESLQTLTSLETAVDFSVAVYKKSASA